MSPRLPPKFEPPRKFGYPLFFFVGANHKTKKAIKGANGGVKKVLLGANEDDKKVVKGVNKD